MSKSGVCSIVDRRVPQQATMIRVGSVIDNVYKEHGFQEWTKDSHDPESKFNLELLSFRKAVRALDDGDRQFVENAQKVIADEYKLGQAAVEQILGKIGILFYVGLRK